jgi:hypothetical protein
MSMDYHATGAAGGRKALMWLRLVVVSSLIFGCASPLTEARHSFDEARYPDAVAAYRALGREVSGFEGPELFEYALYRGLSHLALGDAVPAQRWLLFAKRLSESSPGLATREQEGRLLSAWRAMGHMPGD